MHIAEVVTIAKSLPLLRLNTYKSLILSYSADYRRIFPKNNGFQILWQHVADSCSGCLGCICSKGAILAVILHQKGKAMDGASISFREELRLDAPQRTGFPEQLPFGMGITSYKG